MIRSFDNLQARPLGTVRCLSLLYAMLIAIASLNPFGPWLLLGQSAWGYLGIWGQHWHTRDVILNVLGYFPLGVLLVWGGYPHFQGKRLLGTVLVFGTMLSLSMEAFQTFIPGRYASNVDVISNAIGIIFGAILGAVSLFRVVLLRDFLVGKGWFCGSDIFFALASAWLCLFLVVDVTPMIALFGVGPVYLTQMINPVMYSLQEWGRSESVMVSTMVVGVGVFLCQLLSDTAPRRRLIVGFMVLAVSIHTLGSWILLGWAYAFMWLRLGIVSGLLGGLLILFCIAYCHTRWLILFGIMALAISILTTMIMPLNPYYDQILNTVWIQGPWAHLQKTLDFVAVLWPLGSMLILLWMSFRRKNIMV